MRWFAAAALVLAMTAVGGGSSRGDELFAEENRFYLAPIVGASWGTLLDDETDPIVNQSLFTAGGAGGVAFARERGQLRLEFEGRYRDGFGVSQTDGPLSASLQVIDNWSAMANLWRDFSVSERVGIYGGGGIGAGGYGFDYNVSVASTNDSIIGSNRITAFAWQVGGGVLYALNERITLDLGYRFYSVGLGDSTLTIIENGTPLFSDSISTAFAASELLLSVRIYEPFRRWR
jgi:opacity protein-like surface antigen